MAAIQDIATPIMAATTAMPRHTGAMLRLMVTRLAMGIRAAIPAAQISRSDREDAQLDRLANAASCAEDEREEAFERRFAADEALNFKALARRNKLLGLWAA